eukprot:gene17455-19201_t
MMTEGLIQQDQPNETTPDKDVCSVARNTIDKYNLSRSAGSSFLQSALNRVKVNLSSSCFATLSNKKENIDNDDLTNLSWLHDRDILKGISPSSKPRSTTATTTIHHGSSDDKSNHRFTLKNYEVFLEEDSLNGCETITVPKFAKENDSTKPPYSFSMLIFMAIESSPSKRLPVKDIYSWIVENFSYFRNAPLGWKNSVRHNLSLNKCFKKVERDKSQGVGKGSLWCIDPESRPTLLQGMRKNQVLLAQNDPQGPTSFLSTPPPSPGNSFNGGHRSFNSDGSMQRGGSPDFDDKEFDAAAAMCTMSTPRELRAIEHERIRSQTSTPTEDVHTSPTLLNRWRKFIEPLSDSDSSNASVDGTPVRRPKIRPAGESGTAYTIANLLTDVNLRSSQSLKRSANWKEKRRLLRQQDADEADADEEYLFDHNSEDEEEDNVSDEEIDDNMKKLVERDTLGDSGYGEGNLSAMSDHTYFKTPKRARQLNRSQKKVVEMGAQALLSLAKAASEQLGENVNQQQKE